jgi:hypothetical protein
LIETDVGEVAEFVIASHRAMVVEDGSAADRTMRIRRAAGGFTLDSFFFEEEGSAAFLFDLIRLRIVTAFVELRPDLIWIHSGVVARPDGALMIVAPSGQGKSTLVTHLCVRGWRFLSDEMAPVDSRTSTVLPYPRTPVRRIDPGYDVDQHGSADLDKVTFNVPVELLARESVPIRGIVFPVFFHRGATVVNEITPGNAALELLKSCTNFPDQDAKAFTALARLASEVPCRRVAYGNGEDAADVLHRLGDGIFTSA